MGESLETKVKSYLDKRTKTDKLFAKVYAKPNKNLQECCAYIVGEAFKQATTIAIPGYEVKGFDMDDETMFGLAVHYYDEDEIVVNGLPKSVVSATASQSSPTKRIIGKKRDTNNEPGLFG